MHNRLKIIRKALELSQKDMAAYIGCGYSVWQKYEKGASKPGSDVIKRLKDKGFDANWILSGEGTMELTSSGNSLEKGINMPKVDYTQPAGDEDVIYRDSIKLANKLIKDRNIDDSLQPTLVGELCGARLWNKQEKGIDALMVDDIENAVKKVTGVFRTIT